MHIFVVTKYSLLCKSECLSQKVNNDRGFRSISNLTTENNIHF